MDRSNDQIIADALHKRKMEILNKEIRYIERCMESCKKRPMECIDDIVSNAKWMCISTIDEFDDATKQRCITTVKTLLNNGDGGELCSMPEFFGNALL